MFISLFVPPAFAGEPGTSVDHKVAETQQITSQQTIDGLLELEDRLRRAKASAKAQGADPDVLKRIAELERENTQFRNRIEELEKSSPSTTVIEKDTSELEKKVKDLEDAVAALESKKDDGASPEELKKLQDRLDAMGANEATEFDFHFAVGGGLGAEGSGIGEIAGYRPGGFGQVFLTVGVALENDAMGVDLLGRLGATTAYGTDGGFSAQVYKRMGDDGDFGIGGGLGYGYGCTSNLAYQKCTAISQGPEVDFLAKLGPIRLTPYLRVGEVAVPTVTALDVSYGLRVALVVGF